MKILSFVPRVVVTLEQELLDLARAEEIERLADDVLDDLDLQRLITGDVEAEG